MSQCVIARDSWNALTRTNHTRITQLTLSVLINAYNDTYKRTREVPMYM